MIEFSPFSLNFDVPILFQLNGRLLAENGRGRGRTVRLVARWSFLTAHF